MSRRDVSYWVERADGELMGDYDGYRVHDLDGAKMYAREELEMQKEEQADDPGGTHLVGVRITKLREVESWVEHDAER